MRTPAEIWSYLRGNIRKEWKTAFWTVFILGLLIHFPVIAGDFPNHDGLASMYFDQNMINCSIMPASVADSPRVSLNSLLLLPFIMDRKSLIS